MYLPTLKNNFETMPKPVLVLTINNTVAIFFTAPCSPLNIGPMGDSQPIDWAKSKKLSKVTNTILGAYLKLISKVVKLDALCSFYWLLLCGQLIL